MRTLARQLTYRLPEPEGPGPLEFKRYLTPQLLHTDELPAHWAHYYHTLGALGALNEKESES